MSTPKPYYQDDLATIYHGDSREIFHGLRFDCIVSDPPYGMNVSIEKLNRTPLSYGNWHGVEHSGGINVPMILSADCPTVLFGANGYADQLPSHPGWIVWDKQTDGFKQGSPAELAWTNFLPNLRMFRLNYRGFTLRDDPKHHPMQKPLRLMEWVLSFTEGQVCDPYMGAGSTVVAASKMHRRSIGIEIEERYCEAAARRLDQKSLPLEFPKHASGVGDTS